MLTTPKKYCRVMIYGTLGTACIVGLIAALAVPDKLDTFEAQIAAVYLTLLIGSNKAFNAKPIFGHRILGAITAFTGTGLLPATIIHVAVAQIGPGQNEHVGTLTGYAIVTALTAFLIASSSWIPVKIWQAWEEKQNLAPNWVPKDRAEDPIHSKRST